MGVPSVKILVRNSSVELGNASKKGSQLCSVIVSPSVFADVFLFVIRELASEKISRYIIYGKHHHT